MKDMEEELQQQENSTMKRKRSMMNPQLQLQQRSRRRGQPGDIRCISRKIRARHQQGTCEHSAQSCRALLWPDRFHIDRSYEPDTAADARHQRNEEMNHENACQHISHLLPNMLLLFLAKRWKSRSNFTFPLKAFSELTNLACLKHRFNEVEDQDRNEENTHTNAHSRLRGV